MKTKLCDKTKWFLSGIVVVFTCPSLLYSTLLVILASPEGIPNSLGILGRGCLNYGDAKITVTPLERVRKVVLQSSVVLIYESI